MGGKNLRFLANKSLYLNNVRNRVYKVFP